MLYQSSESRAVRGSDNILACCLRITSQLLPLFVDPEDKGSSITESSLKIYPTTHRRGGRYILHSNRRDDCNATNRRIISLMTRQLDADCGHALRFGSHVLDR
jgi:hypothetical protein